MKAYFINLFNYDRYCNRLLLPLIFEAGQPENAVKTMAHLLAAQQVWLNRSKRLTNANDVVLWPDWQADTFEETINSNHTGWLTFLSGQDNALDDRIAYKNFKGLLFNDALTVILTHVINHGTHHRGQIGQHLKQAGIKTLPVLDYIAFTRL